MLVRTARWACVRVCVYLVCRSVEISLYNNVGANKYQPSSLIFRLFRVFLLC